MCAKSKPVLQRKTQAYHKNLLKDFEQNFNTPVVNISKLKYTINRTYFLTNQEVVIVVIVAKAVDVASYITNHYKELTGEKLDEMKLHKLLYFTQRESFAITGERAFDGDFEGWKYGPVIREVRNDFVDGEIIVDIQDIPDWSYVKI